MQVKLDNRLKAVADLVIPGKTAADIGTDHNYLPVYLVLNGICPYVIATDRARSPYHNACQLVDLLSLSRQIDVRLGDGLSVIKPGEAATITIAGMGGFLIQDILQAAPSVLMQTERLVLQPQKNGSSLRLWLMDNDWQIVAEDLAYDNGFYYEIIAAERGKMILTDDELEFGPCLLGKPHPLMHDYLNLKLNDLRVLTERVSEQAGEPSQLRLAQLKKYVKNIEMIIDSLL